MELEAVSDLFGRIVKSCHAKCISTRYAEADLNKGEAVCVDRLVKPHPSPLAFFLRRWGVCAPHGGIDR